MKKKILKWMYKYSLWFVLVGIIILSFSIGLFCGYNFKPNNKVEDKIVIEENTKVDFDKTVYFNFNEFIKNKVENVKETLTLNDNQNEIIEETPKYNLSEMEVLYDSSVKTCMSVWKITNKTSPQYDYIFNSGLIEFCDDGFLRTEDQFIGIALGSYFGDIGNKFIFELDTGIELKVVKIEEKANQHTTKGFIQSKDYSVIEFVCDFSKMQDKYISNEYPLNGNFNNADEFEGKIVKIWKVEDID